MLFYLNNKGNNGRICKKYLELCLGTVIGILGGLMGLGGAEFRLPVLVGFFRFTTFQGIIINLVVSLVTVAFSLLFRSISVPVTDIAGNFGIILNLLAGSMAGALIGVKLASRII